VRFGAVYTRQTVEFGTNAAPAEVKFKNWHVGVDWRIVGPHGLRAAFTRARDSDASGLTATNLVGAGISAAGVSGSGVVRPILGGDNGAKLWQIRYVYSFSKRTEFNIGYVRLDNDNTGTYNLGGLTGGAGMRPGEDQDAWALAVRHRF
jgi:predicted porin